MTSWHTGNLIRSLTSLEGDMLRNCRHVLSRTLSGCAKPVGDGREHRRTYRCTLKGCEGCFVIRRARIPILITGSARPRPDMMRLGSTNGQPGSRVLGHCGSDIGRATILTQGERTWVARFAIRCAGFKHDTTRGGIAAFCQRRRAMCRQRCVWGGGHFIRASDDGHDATRCGLVQQLPHAAARSDVA